MLKGFLCIYHIFKHFLNVLMLHNSASGGNCLHCFNNHLGKEPVKEKGQKTKAGGGLPSAARTGPKVQPYGTDTERQDVPRRAKYIGRQRPNGTFQT